MAQAGSFVPARRSRRSDRRPHLRARRSVRQHRARAVDLHGRDAGDGQHSAHGATSRSLVVLDEIGRGTATFDGLSIAWAVAEYLATNPHGAAENALRDPLSRADRSWPTRSPGVVNYHVAAREWKDEIVFLRKIVPGRSDRSYGIQVARLAGTAGRKSSRARVTSSPALERDELDAGRPTVGQRHTRMSLNGSSVCFMPTATPSTNASRSLHDRLASARRRSR